MEINVSEDTLRWIYTVIKKQLPASKIYLFGSRVQNSGHATSDLDIAIDLGQPMSLIDLAMLQDVFQESDLSYRIDMSDWHRLSPAFQQIVQETGVLLSEPAS